MTSVFVREGLRVGIHAVVENAYEHVSLFLFPRFGVDDVCGVSGPVDFDLLAGFAVDVHCSPADAFVLQDVVAELRVHQRLGILEPAFFKIFRPEELLVHAVAQQFVLNVVEIGQLPVGDFPGLVTVRVYDLVDFPVGETFFQTSCLFCSHGIVQAKIRQVSMSPESRFLINRYDGFLYSGFMV